jgi:hypothetical protein
MRLLDRGSGPEGPLREGQIASVESGGPRGQGSGAGQTHGVGNLREAYDGGSVGSLPRPPAFDRCRPGALEDVIGASLRGASTLLRASRPLPLSFEASAHGRAPRGHAPEPKLRPTTGTLPLLGFVTSLPLHRHIHRASTPGNPSCPELPSGRRHHPSSSRSALVVSHHLDGFLRAKDRRLVASCCRSWGSPRFPEPAARRPRPNGPKAARPAPEARPGPVPRDAIHPSKSSPRPQPYGVTTACYLRAVGPRRVVDAPRSPLPVGGSGVCPTGPSTSRRCSANGSVASDTLSGAGIARSFHGLVSPSRSDVLRSPPGLSRRDPNGPEGPPERPALARWRITAFEPGTSLPCGRPEPPRESVRRGRSPRPKTQPTSMGFSTLKERSEERLLGRCPLRGPTSSAASRDFPEATRPAPKDRPSCRP